MSTERTDQYPEVSGEEAGIVPPQGGAKAEWPKKIRTLTANELDRLTIDGLGRFYWDGKLVNYEAHPSRLESPVDLDQHAMDLLDRTARELTGPNSAQTLDQPAASEAAVAESPSTEPQPDVATAAAPLTATPADQLVPTAPATAPAAPVITPAPVVEVRRQEVMVPSAMRPETTRLVLSGWQSIGLIIVILGFLVCAASFAASGFVAAHDWGCKAGLVQAYCPPPPVVPKPPARPDIPA